MSAEPFVSVITVSLNAMHTIGDTLASVAQQRCDFAFEHICVDGGSVDGTRTLIDDWAARAAHIVRIYEPDTGIFDAMNKGLRAARGEYVLYLNADDFLVSQDSLARALAWLRPGDPGNPDLIVGHVAVGTPGAWGVWRHLRVPRLLGRLRGWGLFPLHQAQFTRRSQLAAVGGFRAALRSAADVIQYYELESKFRPRIRHLDQDVAFMRAGGKSNQGVGARYRGVRELYGWLREGHGPVRSVVIATLKSLQTLVGVRIGRCRYRRWFAESHAR